MIPKNQIGHLEYIECSRSVSISWSEEPTNASPTDPKTPANASSIDPKTPANASSIDPKTPANASSIDPKAPANASPTDPKTQPTHHQLIRRPSQRITNWSEDPANASPTDPKAPANASPTDPKAPANASNGSVEQCMTTNCTSSSWHKCEHWCSRQ